MFFPDPGSSAWTQYLNVYGKSYNCPTLSSDGTQSAPEYGFNAHLFGKKLQDIPSPFQTLMTTDLKKSAMTGNFALTSTNPADTHYFETAIDPRHAHHFVYSGADGHAAMVPIESSETISQVMKRKGIVIDPATAPKP